MENSTSILQMMFQWWLKVGNLPLQKPSLISLLMSFRVLASLSIFHLYLILYSFQSSELWIVDVDSKFNFSSYYIICCRRILHLSFGRRWSTYNFYMNKWRCGNFPSCCSWIISVAYPVNWQSSMDISLEIRTDNLNVDEPCAFACAGVLVLGHGICIQSTICVLRIFFLFFFTFWKEERKWTSIKIQNKRKKNKMLLVWGQYACAISVVRFVSALERILTLFSIILFSWNGFRCWVLHTSKACQQLRCRWAWAGPR